jgi:hypothetical protein
MGTFFAADTLTVTDVCTRYCTEFYKQTTRKFFFSQGNFLTILPL